MNENLSLAIKYISAAILEYGKKYKSEYKYPSRSGDDMDDYLEYHKMRLDALRSMREQLEDLNFD